MSISLLCFGASIVQGYYDTQGGWVQRLKNSIDEEYLKKDGEYIEVFNLGISGNKSDDLLERLDTDAQSRITCEKAVILISVGTNDSAYFYEKKDNWINKKDYRQNLIKIGERARKFSDKVVFISAPPVNDKILDPCPWAKFIAYRNSDIENYNSIMSDVAKELNIFYVDIFKELNNKNFITKMLKDGVHPNNEGHELIFHIVKDYLEKEGII